MHRASNVVCCYSIALGSFSYVSYWIIATVLIYGVSVVSLLFSAGYSIHRGDWSMSMSLDDSSCVIAIYLVCTIFEDSGRRWFSLTNVFVLKINPSPTWWGCYIVYLLSMYSAVLFIQTQALRSVRWLKITFFVYFVFFAFKIWEILV